MHDVQLLITGGPGSGTTTTGRMISEVLEIPWFDSDEYFHKPTSPPYQEQYSKKERYQLIHDRISNSNSWILSGSISAWGITDIFFSHAVLLNIGAPLRIRRLKTRERERFGSRIDKGGDMYDEHTDFILWASCCETGELDGRSLPIERKFLELNCTHLLEIERESSLQVLTKSISAFLDGKSGSTQYDES